MRPRISRAWRILAIVFAGLFLLLGAQLPARADDMAYMATGPAGTANFGLLDLNTGAYTQIGNSGQQLAGLGAFGGNIYGGLNGGNVLYQVNTATGALTSVGTGSLNYFDFGSTVSGLYAFDSNLNLYSVNPTNGVTTFIGATGLGNSGNNVVGNSANSNTLYLSNGTNLYSVNTTNGHATLLQSLGNAEIGAMVFENGTLYGGTNKISGSASLTVESIDTTTKTNTFVANLNPTTFGNFWGLAPAASVPEPGSLLLLLTGIGFVAVRRVRAHERGES